MDTYARTYSILGQWLMEADSFSSHTLRCKSLCMCMCVCRSPSFLSWSSRCSDPAIHLKVTGLWTLQPTISLSLASFSFHSHFPLFFSLIWYPIMHCNSCQVANPSLSSIVRKRLLEFLASDQGSEHSHSLTRAKWAKAWEPKGGRQRKSRVRLRATDSRGASLLPHSSGY